MGVKPTAYVPFRFFDFCNRNSSSFGSRVFSVCVADGNTFQFGMFFLSPHWFNLRLDLGRPSSGLN